MAAFELNPSPLKKGFRSGSDLLNPYCETLLQIPYGLPQGKLVAPDEAPRGLSGVTCLDCEEPLVAAQGDIVRPYFRHESGVDHLCDYGGEGIRHRLAKLALAERMEQALSKGSGLPILWCCTCGKGKHTGNLLKGATRISIDDTKVGPFMPDIGVFDGARCRVFVEIEQSHANTDEKIAFCEEKDISLVTVDIRDQYDPVAFVKSTPLRIDCNVCLYRLGTDCYCGGSKPPGVEACTKCLRRKNGIDIDICGSYRSQPPRFGAWAAIVTDADGSEREYTGQDLGTEGSQFKMLRRALAELEQLWKGTYEVRIHSTSLLLSSEDAKQILSGRVVSTRYWRSIKDSSGKHQPERQGRLVTDRPKLGRATRNAKEELRKHSA